jgi:hypothetical protein
MKCSPVPAINHNFQLIYLSEGLKPLPKGKSFVLTVIALEELLHLFQFPVTAHV